MVRGLFVVACCLLSVGCVHTPIIVKPLPPPTYTRPILAVTLINKDTSDSDIAKMYRITIEQLIGYSKQLEIIINGYNEQSK